MALLVVLRKTDCHEEEEGNMISELASVGTCSMMRGKHMAFPFSCNSRIIITQNIGLF